MSSWLQIAIFSYNRGPFLQHAVESLERYAPQARVSIYDDASTDEETLRILARLSSRHPVLVSKPGHSRKHGGLYANMQRALDDAEPALPLCFFQDDLQWVRPFEAQDRESILAFFERYPRSGFLSPTFVRRSRKRRPVDAFEFPGDVYFPKAGTQKAGVYYSDIAIVLPERLRAVSWRFASSEPANERQAAAHFDRMGVMFSPLAMWLPLVPAYRGKQKTLALRWGERVSGCGLHPIAAMDVAAVAALRQRDPQAFPYAEDFLTLKRGALPEPWRFNGLQGRRLLKALNGLELSLHRGLARCRRWLGLNP